MIKGDSFFKLYDRVILSRPGWTVVFLLISFATLGYWIKDFRLDASADSLILEHDEDRRLQIIHEGHQRLHLIHVVVHSTNLCSSMSLDRYCKMAQLDGRDTGGHGGENLFSALFSATSCRLHTIVVPFWARSKVMLEVSL